MTSSVLTSARALPPEAVPTPAHAPACPHSEPGSPRLLHRRELLAQGFTDNHIRRARREGGIVALAPGVYLSDVDWQQLDTLAGYRVVVAATIGSLTGEPVVSHLTAGMLHGLVEIAWGAPLDVIRAGGVKARYGRGLRVHRGSLGPDEVVRLHSLTLTSAPRTVLDAVLALPAGPAAALIHRAVAEGHVTLAELHDQLRRHRRAPGVRAAGALIGAVTGSGTVFTARQ